MKKCSKCQQHANFHNVPAEKLSTIMSPWSFSKWGVNLLGPFPLVTGQVKYLIVIIDYFTKWIEAEPLSSIMAVQARKFVWWNIFTRFGILESIITDNGTQFADRKFRDFLSSDKVWHHFISVEHPQANGQVKTANKAILYGLKKGLMGQSPFKLTYGMDAMILVEVGKLSSKVIFQNPSS